MTLYVAQTRSNISEEELAELLSRVRMLPAEATVRPTRSGYLVIAWTESDPLLEAELARSAEVVRVFSDSEPYPLAARHSKPAGTVVHINGVPVGDGRAVLIAGPCSAESPDVLMETARGVKAAGAAMLRVGIFKPRTSPYSFHGLGRDGIAMVCDVKAEVGLPVVSEIMDVRDLDQLACVVDVLQVGARNMQNYTLLTELGMAGRPVLLKRGLSATVRDWLSAAEYLLAHGNENVILCERGIRTFEQSTRFTLDLSAVPVAKELSHLPILVDPSHATGAARYVPKMAAAALAAGADGLLVEVHPRPAQALSDGPQSLDLPGFAQLSEDLRRLCGALERDLVPPPSLIELS